MRKMKHIRTGTVVNVTKFIILKNAWEYFITDDKDSDDIVRAVVKGFETEIGDISLAEIKPFIVAFGTDLKDTIPAPGWEWI